jgi:hypothetical protein
LEQLGDSSKITPFLEKPAPGLPNFLFEPAPCSAAIPPPVKAELIALISEIPEIQSVQVHSSNNNEVLDLSIRYLPN